MEIKPREKMNHGGKKKYFEKKFGRPFLDFSACLNPFPPKVNWSLNFKEVLMYPDDFYSNLKESIGTIFHRNPDEICIGNGSIEIIRTFCDLVLNPGDCVHIHDPTFSEYLYSAQIRGAQFTKDISKAKIHFVCNPNNPTGYVYKRSYLLNNLNNLVNHRRFLFVDEAFIELSNPKESVIGISHENLFVARSLTKAFSVPGIRFGYGFSSATLVNQFEALRLPWTVNAYAEAFAIEAFKHYHELERSRKRIEIERKWLYTKFKELDIEFVPSSANFMLLNLTIPASIITELMFNKGILIRDCSSFGLPKSIRIAIRSHRENKQLLEALGECLFS